MILAFDFALHTGWAIAKNKEIIEYGKLDLDKAREEKHNGYAFKKLREFIWWKFGSHPISAIGWERAHHRGGAATRIAVGLVSTAMAIAADFDCAICDVHTATLKKWATGDCRCGKNSMISRAKEIIGKDVDLTDDEGDAVCVAMYLSEQTSPPAPNP